MLKRGYNKDTCSGNKRSDRIIKFKSSIYDSDQIDFIFIDFKVKHKAIFLFLI